MQLAKEKGLKVTVVHEGGPNVKTGKQPWDSYTNLEAEGVEVKWADFTAGGPAAAVDGSTPTKSVS